MCIPRGELRDFLDVFGLAKKGLVYVTCPPDQQLQSGLP